MCKVVLDDAASAAHPCDGAWVPAVFRTLIVVDNAAFRRSLSELLREHYPTMLVAQAEDIHAAWKKIREIEPRLVFVDIKLREENGLDLAQGIRRFHSDVIIAVVTGHNFPEYRQAAFQNGAHCFLPKDSAVSSDFLSLIDSIRGGLPPQWSLGVDFINPSVGRPWKK